MNNAYIVLLLVLSVFDMFCALKVTDKKLSLLFAFVAGGCMWGAIGWMTA